jgi:SET domain-containing protein 6
LDDATLTFLEAEEVGEWPFGNPGDQVELQGDEVVRAVLSHRGSSAAADSAREELMTERIDWWLEEGQDE